MDLLAGTLVGVWAGASVAVRLTSTALYRVPALLLAAIAEDVIVPTLVVALAVSAVKVWRHDDGSTPRSGATGSADDQLGEDAEESTRAQHTEH